MYVDKTTTELHTLYTSIASYLADTLLDGYNPDGLRVQHLLNEQLRPLHNELKKREADFQEWIANGCPDE
jgi:hypothetical protein